MSDYDRKIRRLRWLMGCDTIRNYYVIGGGALMTVLIPDQARISEDVDVFSESSSPVSPKNALNELKNYCEQHDRPYNVSTERDWLCRMTIYDPESDETFSLDIGQFDFDFEIEYDDLIKGYRMGTEGFIQSKLKAIGDRIQATDLYDIAILWEQYEDSFRSVLEDIHTDSTELDCSLERLHTAFESIPIYCRSGELSDEELDVIQSTIPDLASVIADYELSSNSSDESSGFHH